jgi:hypothetical protein
MIVSTKASGAMMHWDVVWIIARTISLDGVGVGVVGGR